MIYLGATTTPLQEQLAPPDDCRNCLNQHVLPHNTSLTDDTITGHFECPECGYQWAQTWQIQPVLSEPAAKLSP